MISFISNSRFALPLNWIFYILWTLFLILVTSLRFNSFTLELRSNFSVANSLIAKTIAGGE